MALEAALRTGVYLVTAAWLAGCASAPPKTTPSPHDPLERWNRGVYKFNDVLDRAIAKPVAKAYVKVTPQPVRSGIGNFIANLEMPRTMINDTLQGKFKAALVDGGRFVMNTVLGVGGFFDPASRAGLEHNDEDFGQTLGVWGVPAGAFLELPLLGPSTLRDAPAKVADDFLNPAHYTKRTVRWSYAGASLVHKRAELLSVDETIQSAYDPYAFIRDAYLQNRQYKVLDGNVPEEQLEDPDAPAPDKTPPAPEAKPKR